ncbi:MAG: sodium:proton antiporter [Clostridiaceae bacterium]|jgi:multicomponent Na+:H+ antiporter subunit G|nr:sodium:proton antiporter [Clostridiaceae bacterium]
MINWLANICFIGAFISFALGTLGLYKLPDPYSRLHGMGIGDTLGVGFVGLGLLLLSPNWILRVKIMVCIFLFWVINPTMTHLIAKSGLIHGTKPTEGTKVIKE